MYQNDGFCIKNDKFRKAAIRGAYNAVDGTEAAETAEEEGVLIQPYAELAAKILETKAQGYRMEVHAIGDR